MTCQYRVGTDENGLGARLGPLVVTAVLAQVDTQGERWLARPLARELRRDLDDSKRLVSHADTRLGEAWARALVGPGLGSPAALLERLTLEPTSELQQSCPASAVAQCWSQDTERFGAPDDLVARVVGHLAQLAREGVAIRSARTTLVCTLRLNQLRAAGLHRFVADLHAMERLVLEMRRVAGRNVTAICGKVGGITRYGGYFGPLAGWPHTIVEESPAASVYRVSGVGELSFLRDADAHDPLVMLASLVGKYVRELTMARITRHYADETTEGSASGYHDPVTDRFVTRTAAARLRQKIPSDCFERKRSEGTSARKAGRLRAEPPGREPQT